MGLTQEGKVNYFRIPHTCTSSISLTYSPTATRSLTSSLSSVLILSSIPTFVTSLPSVYSFVRSLANILTNTGTDCLFCLNIPFSSVSSYHIPCQFFYLVNIFFYNHFSVSEPLGYGSSGIFSKSLSKVIWEFLIHKEVWIFPFCRCKSMLQEINIQMHKA